LEPLTIKDYGWQSGIYRGQGGRKADMPFLQERVAGTQVQAARLADELYRLLAPALPLFIEHFDHV